MVATLCKTTTDIIVVFLPDRYSFHATIHGTIVFQLQLYSQTKRASSKMLIGARASSSLVSLGGDRVQQTYTSYPVLKKGSPWFMFWGGPSVASLSSTLFWVSIPMYSISWLSRPNPRAQPFPSLQTPHANQVVRPLLCLRIRGALSS